ncbi:MAG: hypothetical protein IKC10_02670 [Alphaproteobacteria bacterium]|nr:hypothetical protein [Alphaproteobacteria bacterium]
MKLYHYIARPNTALEEGILSFAKNPNADLRYYFKRSNETTHEGIVKWMESCFEGRSRAIRGFSEPIQWTEKSMSLKDFIDNADMYSIDLDALDRDGLLEAVYVSPSVKDVPTLKEQWECDELLIKLYDYNDISTRPVDWSVCNDELGHRFAYVPYYIIVIKDGVIPPKYIKKED